MVNKSKKILSEISPGELLDKISILEIKLEKVRDQEGQKEIKKEYSILKEVQNSNIKITDELKKLFDELKSVNSALWDIEDKIRICEKNKDYGEVFIKLARGVYLSNDKRSKIKSKINTILGSNIKEVKEYVNY